MLLARGQVSLLRLGLAKLLLQLVDLCLSLVQLLNLLLLSLEQLVLHAGHFGLEVKDLARRIIPHGSGADQGRI